MPTSILANYLSDVAREMRAQSLAMRRDFATHRPSAGANREDLVESFLSQHLPKKFGVSTGLVISSEGVFSNQADLLVVDDQNNAPLYGTARNKLWPVEAISAFIEVKTSLGPAEIADAIAKARRFKCKRSFLIVFRHFTRRRESPSAMQPVPFNTASSEGRRKPLARAAFD